ncbi:MAG: AAA family ATPase [Thermoanaerobaculia bacterium]|nr:AAA family ATPase [Thermoanaerobaculia bacterium]
MIKLPYGIADFRRIRQEGMIYVDRTAHIRDVEQLGSVLVFLRPRRFGKSLWLQTLASYYDLRRAEEFEQLFGGLAIGREPTPLRNRYFVLQWDFSVVKPSGGVGEITNSLREHAGEWAKRFRAHYADFLPETIEAEGSPEAILSSILRAVEQTPYKLYLLIDEYDNFINEVMASDVTTYRALVEADGPFKLLFKAVKSATQGRGLERVFITGVAPLALSDLTSGFNIARNLSLDPDLRTLCGFREKDLRDLLQTIADDKEIPPEQIETTVATLRTWYNGYRFAPDPPGTSGSEESLVYNPTNSLYFLEHLKRWGTPPDKLYDENLRADNGKLIFLAKTFAGAGVIEHLSEGRGEIEVPRLEQSFSLADLTARIDRDRGAIVSLLFYMGLLTLTDVPGRLEVPNLVVKKLLLDRLLEIYLPGPDDSYAAREIALRFCQKGDLAALLEFFEQKLLPVLSSRDRGAAPKQPGHSGSGINEMAVKALFLSLLFDDTHYVTFSELELDKGYADLCLLVRPEMRRHGYFDLLFEFKLVRRLGRGEKAKELARTSEASLRRLPPVAAALAEARAQAERYRAGLVGRFGEAGLRLRCYVVVLVGLERIIGDEIAG